MGSEKVDFFFYFLEGLYNADSRCVWNEYTHNARTRLAIYTCGIFICLTRRFYQLTRTRETGNRVYPSVDIHEEKNYIYYSFQTAIHGAYKSRVF